MKRMLAGLLVLAGAFAMTGCASSPTVKDLAKEQADASAIRAKAAEDHRQREQERMEANLSQVPEWALESPKPDGTGVYAVGMGEGSKLRLALRKATLEAEFGLAKLYNQELSGSERAYAQDNGDDALTEQYTALVDKLVSQVPVVGFEVIHQEVKPIDGQYHAYVLLKLPYDQFNRVLQSQRAKARDESITTAFDDLERRLERRRQQRLEEQAITHQQQTEDMKLRHEILNGAKSPQDPKRPADEAQAKDQTSEAALTPGAVAQAQSIVTGH